LFFQFRTRFKIAPCEISRTITLIQSLTKSCSLNYFGKTQSNKGFNSVIVLNTVFAQFPNHEKAMVWVIVRQSQVNAHSKVGLQTRFIKIYAQ
jgi:hypothetical protein